MKWFVVITLCPFICSAMDIQTISGQVYSNVIVKRAEPDALVVMGAKGIFRIPFVELPTDVQNHFGYDKNAAEKYAAAVSRQRAAALRERHASTAQAEIAPQIRQLEKAIEQKRITVVGKVLSVNAQGVLLTDSGKVQVYQKVDTSDKVKRIDGPRTQTATKLKDVTNGEPIFICGIEEQLTDGEVWAGAAYPAGVYQYPSVGGALKTVKRFATSAQLAAQLQLGE